MRFGVIVTLDIWPRESVEHYVPRKLRRKLDCTEQGSDRELWNEPMKHRKYTGVLRRDDFDALVDVLCLRAECDTGGSLGVSWAGSSGFAPAISFSGAGSDGTYVNAYVTPLPDVKSRRKLTRKREDVAWRRLRRALFKVYG